MSGESFCVAGFRFEVLTSEAGCLERWLPSFRPFRCNAQKVVEPIFRLSVEVWEESWNWKAEEASLLDDDTNDMGHVQLFAGPDGYCVLLQYRCGGPGHGLRLAKDFSSGVAYVCRKDIYVGEVLSSMLRIFFSQAILLHDGVSLHASSVWLDGRAYLFMGKSGTGKSTHAALWVAAFPGCGLLNDDNPVVRLQEGRAVAYGTPWSGKTPCYKNLEFPVAGMVRLRQASANRFYRCEDVDAFIALLPGFSVINRDERLHSALCEILIRLCGEVPVGLLDCLPDSEAAFLCRNELNLFK